MKIKRERGREERNVEETDKTFKPEENLIQGTEGNSLILHLGIKIESKYKIKKIKQKINME